jgi:hypothetical protein
MATKTLSAELKSAMKELRLGQLLPTLVDRVGGHSEGRKSGRVSLGLMARFAAARSLASLAR